MGGCGKEIFHPHCHELRRMSHGYLVPLDYLSCARPGLDRTGASCQLILRSRAACHSLAALVLLLSVRTAVVPAIRMCKGVVYIRQGASHPLDWLLFSRPVSRGHDC